LLALPAEGLPAGFSVLVQPEQRSVDLTVVSAEGADYLDLGELAAALGGRLDWETVGERIEWELDSIRFVFDDLLFFFSAGGGQYQLVAPCRLDTGRFLVPVQVAVEYLPRLLPQRFSYNKLDGRLVDHGAQTRPLSGVRPPQSRQPGQPSAVAGSGQNYRIRTVVIDPGHGGKDPGTIGRRYKSDEKQIVLDVAALVAKNLEKNSDLEVILTRDRDQFIPLAQRGQIANRKGTGLFVSIHVNASSDRKLNGSSTYFLSAAKTDEERATAMLENGALKYEVDERDQGRRDEISLILQDMAQNEYLRESQELSSIIQQEITKIKGINDRGLRQANFAVLRGAYMPAALVETAYISNPADEKLLNSTSFRSSLAGAITAGILKYVDQYHRKLAGK
jgi:N-acetylmuramoyl-L-alanine amidase